MEDGTFVEGDAGELVEEGVGGSLFDGIGLYGIVVEFDDSGVDDKAVLGDDGFEGVDDASFFVGGVLDFFYGTGVTGA